MSTNVGAVDFELLLNSNPFNKGLKNASTQIKSSGIEKLLKNIGKMALTAFSVKAIVNFGKECISLGSDLTEVQNVVDVTFGNLNTEVNKFAESAIDKFGLGQTVTKKYVGTFGAMSKAFGFSNQEALAMSETLTGLAGDVASFYNLSSDEAYTKLKSVFTGETETLKDLGVVMTQNALDQYALANGYGKTTANMSEQEKVALRYKFVLDKLSLANGDFARTSDSWANQTRVLSLRFNELKATLGQGFINIFTPIVKGINFVLSKLQVLANAFKSFTEMIFGNAGGENSSSPVSNLATDATNASNAVSGIGDSAKKAKKDLLGLRGIDEINNLTTSSEDSSSSSGAGGSIDTSGIGNMTNSAMQQANIQMDTFIGKTKELASIFKEGFNISFGDTNFDGIKQHLGSIKDTLIEIWADPKVLNSASNWVKTVCYSLGQAVGAVARIGTNIVEGLVGSIDKYLSQNKERIKTHISNMFDISSKDFALTGNFMQALGEISDVLSGDTAKQIGADLIAMFANPLMSAKEVIGKFAVDLKSIFMQPIIDNVDKIKEAIENTLKPIETVLHTIGDAFTYIGDKWNEVYDTHIHPLMDSIKTGLSDTFSKFLDVYNQYVAPALQRIANKIRELWEQHLRPLVDKVAEFCGSIFYLLKALWDNILKPVIDWIIQNIIPVLVPIFESIWNTISSVFGAIADTIGGIIQTFKGLIDFIVGIFTGDWKKAWEGIKTFFTGIWNAIKGVVSIVWNAIKGIIETAVNIIKGIITTVFNAIKSIISNIFNAVKNTVTNIWNGIKNNIINSVNNIKNGIINAFQTAYNKITSIFRNIGSFFSGVWNGIKGIFSGVGSWFSNKFQQAYNGITGVFKKIGSFFSNVWNGIKNTFSKLGTSIGNAISNAVKSGINGVISLIERTINSAIRLINGAIGLINLIPGVNVGRISSLYLPRLAQGGYVKANTPQLAMIGDNRHQGEVVAPEDKLHSIMAEELSKFQGTGSNNEVISLLKEILKYLRNSGGDTVLNVDNIELARAVIKGMKALQAKSDKPILDFI